MIADIEDGKVGIVICKDLLRLGRNNALVAFYTEIFFVEHNIRFIAITDSIDSAKGDNEMMGFRSVINEFYERDISKKVRSAFRARALNGEHIAGKSPYGYLLDPADKRKLIIDEEAAVVVRRIFWMAMDGLSPQNIALRLFKERVLIPSALDYQRTGRMHRNFDVNRQHHWSDVSVKNILRNQVYIGHMVNNRQSTKSFKSKSKINLPEEEWIIAKHTHLPIIDEETFEKVRKLISVKKRENKRNLDNIFVSLVFCADCGRRLNFASGGETSQGR